MKVEKKIAEEAVKKIKAALESGNYNVINIGIKKSK